MSCMYSKMINTVGGHEVDNAPDNQRIIDFTVMLTDEGLSNVSSNIVVMNELSSSIALSKVACGCHIFHIAGGVT